jgi:hypothetical protein
MKTESKMVSSGTLTPARSLALADYYMTVGRKALPRDWAYYARLRDHAIALCPRYVPLWAPRRTLVAALGFNMGDLILSLGRLFYRMVRKGPDQDNRTGIPVSVTAPKMSVTVESTGLENQGRTRGLNMSDDGPHPQVAFHVVFLAYDVVGKYEWIYSQAIYAMLSLMGANGWQRIPSGVSVVFYIDDPQSLGSLSSAVDVRLLTRRSALESMGPSRYIHRLKTTTLIDAVSRSHLPVLFIDADMVFKGPIDDRVALVLRERMLMYAREYAVRGPAERAYDPNRLLFEAITKGRRIPPGYDPYVYNSGIVGIHPETIGVLHHNLELLDEGLKSSSCHTWEQIALSAAAQLSGVRIHTVDDVAHHYWDQREEYGEAIAPLISEIRSRKMLMADAIEYVRSRPFRVPPYRKPSLLVDFHNL